MPPKASKRKAANGYKLPDPIPAGEIVTGLTKKKSWRVGKSIGIGGFGEIYLCSEDTSRNVGDDATLAMKIEPHENGPLFVEMNFYIRAAQPESVSEFKRKKGLMSLGMPVHCGSGSHTYKGEKYRFLIMERFGKDLQKIFLSGKKKFPPKAAYTIAIKTLDTLQYIHSQGYVHNDIKAQNLLLGHGRTKENDVVLVDFGLVSKYLRDGVHLEYKPDARKAHDGTIEYTSRDAHIGAHSRRSDLEILGYNLVHWMSGTLPWMDNLTNAQYVHMQKQGFMNDVPTFLQRCFGDSDYPAVLEEFLEYVKGLEFDTEPDYDKCRDMFKKTLKKLKIPYDGKLDFSAPKTPVKKVGSSPIKKSQDKRKGKQRVSSQDDESPSPPKKLKSKTKKSPIVISDSEEEQATPRITRKRPIKKIVADSETDEEEPVVVKKTTKAMKKLKVDSKDIACQTSPGFVRQAKAAKKASGSNNPEMVEFVAKAVTAAKAATRKSPRSTPVGRKTSKKSTAEDENDLSAANPTPAMMALMKKRQDSAMKKKR